jgi:hypothetical protein
MPSGGKYMSLRHFPIDSRSLSRVVSQLEVESRVVSSTNNHKILLIYSGKNLGGKMKISIQGKNNISSI